MENKLPQETKFRRIENFLAEPYRPFSSVYDIKNQYLNIQTASRPIFIVLFKSSESIFLDKI